jgi:hypothetical protein
MQASLFERGKPIHTSDQKNCGGKQILPIDLFRIISAANNNQSTRARFSRIYTFG